MQLKPTHCADRDESENEAYEFVKKHCFINTDYAYL